MDLPEENCLMLANAAAATMLNVEEMNMTFTEFIRKYDINSGVYLDMGNEPSSTFCSYLSYWIFLGNGSCVCFESYKKCRKLFC